MRSGWVAAALLGACVACGGASEPWAAVGTDAGPVDAPAASDGGGAIDAPELHESGDLDALADAQGDGSSVPDASHDVGVVDAAAEACSPKTCFAIGYACGSIPDDGCGHLLNCGDCVPPEVCTPNGPGTLCVNPNPDACVPLTCGAQAIYCGPAPDGCGGTLDCGSCTINGEQCLAVPLPDGGTQHSCGEPTNPKCQDAGTACGPCTCDGCCYGGSCISPQNMSGAQCGTVGGQCENCYAEYGSNALCGLDPNGNGTCFVPSNQ